MSGATFEEITKSKPEKQLVRPRKQKSGRNFQGKVTVRHRGGGAKRQLRIVDFKREKYGVPGRVAAIEYDPNRTGYLALIYYADGEKRYILAPVGLKVGDTVMSGPEAEVKPGNALPLKAVPTGSMVHNIEMQAGRGAQLVRTAGASAQLIVKEGGFAHVRLPSGEIRLIRLECMATIGQVGNVEHQNIALGKAGRKRLKGWRPDVRGQVMSPRAHPHGGGEGRCPRGMPGPKTPWGKPALGLKTRKRDKPSEKWIIRHRKGK